MSHRAPRPRLDLRHLRHVLAELVGWVATAGARSFRAMVGGVAAVLLGGTSMVTGGLAADAGSSTAMADGGSCAPPMRKIRSAPGVPDFESGW